MENKEKVEVVSKVGGTVIFTVPDLHYRREFRKKGAKISIDKALLEEAMYDPGVEALFREGILYIENMKDKQDLGLEPEDATEPENIIVLNDGQMRRYLTVAPVNELKDVLEKLSPESKNELANYAIENDISDYQKVQLIKESTGIDILKAIELKHAEEDSKDNK